MANTITLTDIAANRIFAGDRAAAQITVSGTYTATGTPPAIQAQVVTTGDIYAILDVYAIVNMYGASFATGASANTNPSLAQVAIAWTTIVANPAAGTFTGTLSVPVQSSMLLLQVRFADLSAQANGFNP